MAAPVGTILSPWHDVTLYNKDGTVNFICEIPKETSAKMEVATVCVHALLLILSAMKGLHPVNIP